MKDLLDGIALSIAGGVLLAFAMYMVATCPWGHTAGALIIFGIPTFLWAFARSLRVLTRRV